MDSLERALEQLNNLTSSCARCFSMAWIPCNVIVPFKRIDFGAAVAQYQINFGKFIAQSPDRVSCRRSQIEAAFVSKCLLKCNPYQTFSASLDSTG